MLVRQRHSVLGVPGAATPIESDRFYSLELDAAGERDSSRIEDAVAIEIETDVVAGFVVIDSNVGALARVVCVITNRIHARSLDIGSVFTRGAGKTNTGFGVSDSHHTESGND